MKKTDNISLVFSFLAGLLLLFLLAPLIGLFLSTTPLSLFETAQEPEVQKSIWLTISSSMAATLIFSIGAIPLAYLLARKKFIFKRILLGIINIPVIIPHSAAGIALLGIISRDTLLGKIAESLGFSFVNNPAGIMVAMAFVSLPYLINAAIDGFLSVPERLEKVALTLGASKSRVFFTISLPLAWRSILTGLIMMWGRGLSEFGAIIIIAYHPMVTPVMIFERFSSYGLQYATPVTVLFISICLIIFVAMKFISKKTNHAETGEN
ncbi:MAG: molybdenum ABC transporter permease [Bacteroidetes bacterium CG_4_10_14_3_um_filter_42_6]|nr:MAG: molybdenum ABC transporter permease [Bacteroidetes bacterium CG_4_10_14_3_um_filter_42_6]PJB55023.1 MAG: molybdenum ABC transporter permease [Bacteroidetes bacterium CG_4_9_14_3_um_filter_41_19]